jgi:hypothetical protein
MMARLRAGPRGSDHAKTEIIKCFNSFVKAGLAQWGALANGDVEFRLLSGEVFHLNQTTITRVG